MVRTMIFFLALILLALPMTAAVQETKPAPVDGADAGVVAMHSRPGEPVEDAFLLLRSDLSRSASSSCADGDSFGLQAFGEELAIFSGCEAKARNPVPANDQGQVTPSPSSQRRIAESLFSLQFDYIYVGRLDKLLRHVIFLRPDCWVMVDELAAKEPSTYDWLLHSWEKPVVEQNRVTVSRDDSRLLVQFAEPQKLDISITDQPTVPPENKPANQWHLAASTPNASKQGTFVTVLYPYKAGDEASLPRIERIDEPGIRGVSVMSGEWEDMVLVNRFDAPMVLPKTIADARVAAVRQSTRGVSSVLLCQARSLSLDRTEVLSSSAPVTLSMQIGRGARSLVTNCSQETEIKLKIEQPVKPKVQVRIVVGRGGRTRLVNDKPDPRIFQGTVKVDGRTLSMTDFRFDHKASTITLKLSPGEHAVEIKARMMPL